MLKFGAKTVLYDDVFKLAEFLETQVSGKLGLPMYMYVLSAHHSFDLLLACWQNLSVGQELDRKENADCQAFVSLVKSSLLVAMVSTMI